MQTEANALVEQALKNYYRRQYELQIKKQQLDVMEKNIHDLRLTLKYAYDLIPHQNTVWKYELTATIAQFRDYLLALTHRTIKLRLQIMYLESELAEMSFLLSVLEPVDRIICANSYGVQEKSNIQTGAEINMDEKAVRYRRKKLIARLRHVSDSFPVLCRKSGRKYGMLDITGD